MTCVTQSALLTKLLGTIGCIACWPERRLGIEYEEEVIRLAKGVDVWMGRLEGNFPAEGLNMALKGDGLCNVCEMNFEAITLCFYLTTVPGQGAARSSPWGKGSLYATVCDGSKTRCVLKAILGPDSSSFFFGIHVALSRGLYPLFLNEATILRRAAAFRSTSLTTC